MDSWILIENGLVIDGCGNKPRPATSVLIRGNRIFAVGSNAAADRVPRGEPLERIDAAGRTVMPGMIDAHCHISFGQTRTQEEQDLYTSVELRTLRSAWNMKRILRSGVTGFSQPGGSYYIGVGIREGAREGLIEGPRMTTAGRFITTSNGISDFYPTAVGVPESSIGVLANTQDEMIAEVRRQVKNGVDLIKLADSPYGDYQAFMDDEMKVVADLAHQLRTRVTIHARGSAEVNAAVNAELDWIMHGNVMTDEVIERLAKSRIPLVPVLTLIANFADFGHLVGTPARDRDGARRMMEKTADTMHRAHRAGVKFVTGTDSGFAITPYGDWHARELELLMEYSGMSALEAIQAATQNAAVVLGLEGEVGEIGEGKLADVLIVNGNPAADIRVLQDRSRIDIVIKDGKRVELEEDDLIVHPYDRAIVYSTTELTWDLVYGAGAEAPKPESPPSPADDGKELARNLKAREATGAARAKERLPLP